MNDRVSILSIPNEILYVIFDKLPMMDVLSSIANVNQRFHQLVLDSPYISEVNLNRMTNIGSVYEQTSVIDPEVLRRICTKVLSQVHRQVQKLTVEECSMKVLHVGNYPQLYSLSLVNFHEEILYKYLSDDPILRDRLSEQITHLSIDMIDTDAETTSSKTKAKILHLILSLCKKLLVLNFCDMFLPRKHCIRTFDSLFESYSPATLIELKITVPMLTDCLFLLDGRLICLSKLVICISSSFHNPFLFKYTSIDSTKKLSTLKSLSLTSLHSVSGYDTQIVPLLCRMINLEEIKLNLSVNRYDLPYLDGDQLHDQFLSSMTHLKKLTFYIKSTRRIQLELATNEEIQRSFIGRGYPQVATCVYNQSNPYEGVCHVYTLPYDFDSFLLFDKSFQGGVCHKVRLLKISDNISYEHQLFETISKNFPNVEFLYIDNMEPQKGNQHSSTLITFSYLTLLDLKYAHDDYAKQFLLKEKMYLPRLLNLIIRYQSLITITNHFTNDPKDFSLDQLESLDVGEVFVPSENSHRYFPLL